MTFASSFGRTFSPTFQPKSQAGGYTTWWTLDGAITSCVAAYQPKGAASYAASKVNLTGNTTYNLTEVVGTVGWNSSDGFVGDKTNYFDTGVVPSLGYSAIIKVTSLDYETEEQLFGSYAVDKRFMAGIVSSTRAYFGYGDKYTLGAYGYSADTVLAMTVNGGYEDGSLYQSMSNVSFSTTLSTYLLARNYSAPTPTDANVQAFAIYNATLTPQNISDLTTAMNAL